MENRIIEATCTVFPIRKKDGKESPEQKELKHLTILLEEQAELNRKEDLEDLIFII